MCACVVACRQSCAHVCVYVYPFTCLHKHEMRGWVEQLHRCEKEFVTEEDGSPDEQEALRFKAAVLHKVVHLHKNSLCWSIRPYTSAALLALLGVYSHGHPLPVWSLLNPPFMFPQSHTMEGVLVLTRVCMNGCEEIYVHVCV
mgnify:CR=1 FL=1